MKVSVSVGFMEMVGCWFVAMPTCHGCRGFGWAVQIRCAVRDICSVSRDSQADCRDPPWRHPGSNSCEIPCCTPGSFVALLRSRVDHDLPRSGYTNRCVHYARCGGFVDHDLQRRTRLRLLKARQRRTYSMLWNVTPWGRRRSAVPRPDAHQV